MIQGFVDEIVQDAVRGWCFAQGQAGPLDVRVVLGAVEIARGTADIFRPDIAGLSGHDGRCGFAIALPAPLAPADLMRLGVLAGETELVLAAGATVALNVRPMPRSTAAIPFDARYDLRMPAAANAIDIFRGQWAASLPGFVPAELAQEGLPALHADPRLDFFERSIGGFAGRRVLELGPLEASHTFAMHARGAAAIVAIEANIAAFLKCLVVKNLFDLSRARFVLGDFGPYLQHPPQFDVLLACGVLYHMSDPLALIRGMLRAAPAICVWTHYFDEDVIRGRRDLAPRFAPAVIDDFEGLPVVSSEQTYPDEALAWGGFCGGAERRTRWLTRDSLVSVFRHAGFAVDIGEDQPDHPHGPALLFVAHRM